MRQHARFKRGGRAAVLATLCTAAFVAASCGSALALGSLTEYSAPTSPTTIDSKYITVGGHNSGIGSEILGLTDVTYGTSKMPGSTTLDTAKTDGLLGLFATDLNSNPSQYYRNYFYNLYATANGKDLTDHYSAACASGMQKPDSADTTGVADYGGLSNTISYRPDILFGCDSKSFADGNGIKLRSSGTTVSASRYSLANSGYDTQVEAVRNLKSSSSTYYKTGDENYDPYLVTFSVFYGDPIYQDTETAKRQEAGAYSLYSNIPVMYNLANSAESVMASDSTKTTRYGSPLKIAQKYEAYLRGMQDYVLKSIATKKTTRKTVAMVKKGGIDTSAQTVTLYKNTADGSKSVWSGTGSSFAIPRFAEILENVCDNVAGYTTDGTTWTASMTAADLMKADSIILESSADEASLKTLLSDAGYKDESAYPSIFVNAPSTAGSLNSWGADAAQNAGVYLGFVYPKLINPVYAMAYYYTNFYHVKSDTTTLSNALGYNISSMSLPKGVSRDLSGYSSATVQSYINEGLAYYKANKSSIDTKRPKLTTSSNFNLSDYGVKAKKTYTVGKASYYVKSTSSKTVYYYKAKTGSAKSTTVPSSVQLVDGKTYKVVGISAKAFKGTKIKTVTVKTLKLTKSSVKGSLKSSKVTTVKVSKKYVSKYKKYFAKSNSGKSIKVKAA